MAMLSPGFLSLSLPESCCSTVPLQLLTATRPSAKNGAITNMMMLVRTIITLMLATV